MLGLSFYTSHKFSEIIVLLREGNYEIMSVVPVNRIRQTLLALCSCAVALEAMQIPKLSRFSVDVAYEDAENHDLAELLKLHFQHLALQRKIQEACTQKQNLGKRIASVASRPYRNSLVAHTRELISKSDITELERKTSIDNHVMTSEHPSLRSTDRIDVTSISSMHNELH